MIGAAKSISMIKGGVGKSPISLRPGPVLWEFPRPFARGGRERIRAWGCKTTLQNAIDSSGPAQGGRLSYYVDRYNYRHIHATV